MLPWNKPKRSNEDAAEDQTAAVPAEDQAPAAPTEAETAATPEETPVPVFPVEAASVEEASPVGSVSTDDTHVALVSGEETVIWDIKNTPLLLPTNNAAQVYRSIEEHGEQHSDTVEYYALDLSNTLESHNPARVALNLNEAWDLSTALVEEITHRAENPEEGNKHFIVVLNDGNDLFSLTDTEDTELYQKFLGNMQTIEAHARAYDISVLVLPGNVHRD